MSERPPATTEPDVTASFEVQSAPSPGPSAHSESETRVWRAVRWLAEQTVGQRPTFLGLLLPAMVAAVLLYSRSPWTNCIFDEQEALLANPYVNGVEDLGFWDAFKRDFWGLPHTRSIGSYRPIPNLVWRLLWNLRQDPSLPHWMNVVLHGTNVALLGALAYRITKRELHGWLTAGVFLCSAVLTEAVSGVVGIADILGGMGVLLALWALAAPLPLTPILVFLAMLLGLFSKESAIVGVPLIGFAALVLSPCLHPRRPWRALRSGLSLVSATGALVLYTELRKRWFPVERSDLEAPLPAGTPELKVVLHEFLRWFNQPKLPHDPINNPLIDASELERFYGGLQVYAKGFGQTLLPVSLAGDYSFPQELPPETWLSVGVLLGAALMFGVPLLGVALWLVGFARELRERRALREAGGRSPPTDGGQDVPAARAYVPSRTVVALALLSVASVWAAVAYFPHSNIPVLLPTVRAERFWYLPVLGLAPAYALGLEWLALRRLPGRLGAWAGPLCAAVLLGFQAQQARLHAIDYTNDLTFWRATARTSSRSAKAHLNYSVMLGARGFMQDRLRESATAAELAPRWPMAHVYYGDTLCRMQRADEAWPHYVRGFELGPNDLNLIALALQCLWDQGAIQGREAELLQLAADHSGTWLAYLARDIVNNGEVHQGVDPKYRPRGYNQGPRKQ